MSKTFTCCELIQRIKDFQATGSKRDEDKYLANEFLHKAALKITGKRIKEWKNFDGKKEPVWTADYDYLFCEKCKKWFEQQKESQIKLIDTQIEKEKADGTFYSNPATQKSLRDVKEKVNRWSKEIEQRELKKQPPLPFGKSPQE